MTRSFRLASLAAVLTLSVSLTLSGCGATPSHPLPGGAIQPAPGSEAAQTPPSAPQTASATGQAPSATGPAADQTAPLAGQPVPAAITQTQSFIGPTLPPAGVSQAPGLHLQTPANVRGIYLTGWTAGSPKRLNQLLDYVQRNGLNTMVIDVKDDDGRLSFDLPGTQASAISASADKISDPGALLQMLHQKGIYVVGRIVTFADPYASRKHPDWAIIQNGRLWTDYRGISWLSPWNKSARDYDIEIGVAAAKFGFDEIQYDYVRLPESHLKGYNEGTTVTDRIAQVTSFLREARDTIRQQTGVPVSADVFGITSVTDGDQGVGQSYPEIARVVDYISPMDYPSLYAQGEFGIANPNARPYDVIWQTIARATQRTADLPLTVQRPWIQDYNLGEPRYGPAEVNAELDALAAAGIHSFMLWNAGNVYTDGVDFARIDQTPIKPPNAVWLNVLHSLIPVRIPVELPAAVPAVPQAASVRATGHAGSFTAELWATGAPLPADDDAILSGTPTLVVSGADSAQDLPALPAAAAGPDQGTETVGLATGETASLAGSGNGVSLTWTHAATTYRIWAGTRPAALDAANSMRSVTLLEGR